MTRMDLKKKPFFTRDIHIDRLIHKENHPIDRECWCSSPYWLSLIPVQCSSNQFVSEIRLPGRIRDWIIDESRLWPNFQYFAPSTRVTGHKNLINFPRGKYSSLHFVFGAIQYKENWHSYFVCVFSCVCFNDRLSDGFVESYYKQQDFIHAWVGVVQVCFILLLTRIT